MSGGPVATWLGAGTSECGGGGGGKACAGRGGAGGRGSAAGRGGGAWRCGGGDDEAFSAEDLSAHRLRERKACVSMGTSVP